MVSGGVRAIVWWLIANEFIVNTIGSDGANHDHREEWVVRLAGGPQVASLMALQSGYEYLGPVLGFKDTYIWIKDDKTTQKKRGGIRLTKALNSKTKKIIWADRQKVIERHKRDYIWTIDSDSEEPLTRDKRVQWNELNSVDNYEMNLHEASFIDNFEEFKPVFNDELYNQQWHLRDLSVESTYQLGVTGRGVRVAILDDGIDYIHEDLDGNFDPYMSYDFNERDDDPLPRYMPTGMNSHGTRCAGEIAMEANNRKCGVGVAFQASIGGIKLLDGLVNDRIEGEALGYKPEYVDIYTASWGPADDGKSMEAPGRLASEALVRGITMGRNGKGCIYVWASGNGGAKSDNCGCDGYVGSIYTIAIGSVSQSGKFPWYGEMCPATLATTCSSGGYQDQMIATTDLNNTCTTRHTGTSASAPLAAGILALALEVNNDLTWRDVQHLIVWTSECSPLRANPGWLKNSAGFWFNPRFGFGLMNAFALVTTSYNWTSVPEKSICKVPAAGLIDRRLVYGNSRKLRFEITDECQSAGEEIKFLEHVEVEANLEYSLRGALQMHLTAPSGMKVQILRPRKLDDSPTGFTNWKFMSVATWGEDPRGTWDLDILDEIGPSGNNGTLGEFILILHGTSEIPYYRKNGPRIYNENYHRRREANGITRTNEIPYSAAYKTLKPRITGAKDSDEKNWFEILLQRFYSNN